MRLPMLTLLVFLQQYYQPTAEKDLKIKLQKFVECLNITLRKFHQNATAFSTLQQNYKDIENKTTILPFDESHWNEIVQRINNTIQRVSKARNDDLVTRAKELEGKISSFVKTNLEPNYNDSDYKRKGKAGFNTSSYRWYYPCHQSSDVFIPVVKTTDNATNDDIFWTEKLVDMTKPPSDGYFVGTVNGVLRFYPGTQWPQQYDMYDCRHQSWFLQAASSKHDIALMIDRSGSLYGRPLKTIKGIARLLIKLIPANYRFNVFLFNNETVPLKECLGMEPLPATDAVKRTLLAELDEVEALQSGKFNDGLLKLENTFFAKSDRDKTCKKMIVLFTDGKIDFHQERVGETLRRLNLILLVLNFSSPSSFRDNKELKAMTCKVGGHYVFVDHIGDWFQVADMFFDTVASRTVRNMDIVSSRWSDPIITFYNKKTMTLSRALFNKTDSNNTLQGVLGTEILLENFSSNFSMEAGNTAFAIVSLPNGKVINHPRLLGADIVPTLSQVRVDSEEILYPKEPAESAPVTKVKFPVFEKNIEGAMGKMKFQLVVPVNEAYNVSISEMKSEIQLTNEKIWDHYGKNLFTRAREASVHPFNYAKHRVEILDLGSCYKNYTTTWERSLCPGHRRYVLPIVRDVLVTGSAVDSWKNLTDKKGAVYSRGSFLLTRNGVLWSNITYYKDPGKVAEYLEFSADPDKFPAGTLLITRPFRNSVHLTRAITTTYTSQAAGASQNLVLSVTGVAIKYPRFSAVVRRILEENELIQENYEIYLLDHKAYVIQSSVSNEVNFFGVVNSVVFKKLLQNGYYVNKKFKDCLCTKPPPLRSSARKVRLFVSHLLIRVLTSTLSILTSLSTKLLTTAFIQPDIQELNDCCTEIRAYERNMSVTGYRSEELSTCGCAARYAALSVPGSSLVVVVVVRGEEPLCGCVSSDQVTRRGKPRDIGGCQEMAEQGVGGAVNQDVCYDDVRIEDLDNEDSCEEKTKTSYF